MSTPLNNRCRCTDDVFDPSDDFEGLPRRFLKLPAVHVLPTATRSMHAREIIGESRALGAVIRQIRVVAPTTANVMILGETGTGKELVARAIHSFGSRRNGPFIKINCAAIPVNLLESELFGHEKGAFTGAIARRLGRFELAQGGTLFLDEIGDIPMALQPKLLRVLQEREFERLGGNVPIKADVRIIAATCRDLNEMMQEREFRPDLYYRLNVFPIQVPSLRERVADIPALVNHFAGKYAAEFNIPITTIPDATIKALASHDWPGNIRELENIVERAVILTSNGILRPPPDFEVGNLRSDGASNTQAPTLAEMDRSHILHILHECNHVVGGPRGAASRLGLKRTTLISRMKKLGMVKQAC
jgi:transcriptional regulator with GAF, ATPase, and Fis domain